MDIAYTTTSRLFDKVDPQTLNWKPATGSNWMTLGQLIKHITDACGLGCRAFVTGEWVLPDGKRYEDLSPEEVLPPAEKLPTIHSMGEAQRSLERDRAVALQAIDQASEQDLSSKQIAAPWAPGVTQPLGQHLLHMVQHLERHKTQLFYYLKLQGKSVNTVDLWG
jgi:uncharacterized damage-inducible protein DinB